MPIKGDAGNTLLAIAISLFAAILTHKLIEEPIRYGRSKSVRHGWQIALALFAMVVLNSQLLRWNTYTQNILASSKNNIYVNAIADVPAIYQHGCDDWYHSEEVKPCVYGNENAEKTAVLFGDSIGAQWFPALTEIMDPQQWKIIVLTKSSCPMVDVSFFYQRIGREYTECAVWRDKSIEWLQGRHVDRLFVGGTASSAFTEKEWTEGTRRILDRLARNADAIYLIEANPTLEFNGPDCLMKNKADGQGKCQSRSGSPQYTQVAAVLKNVVNTQPKAHWIETSSFVCPDGQCQAMRNDVVIFRDTQHLTASFTALAAPHFLEQIQSHELPIQ